MSDPVVVPCPADEWTAVATNETSLRLWVLDFEPRGYSFTYRDTGGTAPTDLTDAVPLESGVELNFGVAADIYVYPQGKPGSVRIDI